MKTALCLLGVWSITVMAIISGCIENSEIADEPFWHFRMGVGGGVIFTISILSLLQKKK